MSSKYPVSPQSVPLHVYLHRKTPWLLCSYVFTMSLQQWYFSTVKTVGVPKLGFPLTVMRAAEVMCWAKKKSSQCPTSQRRLTPCQSLFALPPHWLCTYLIRMQNEEVRKWTVETKWGQVLSWPFSQPSLSLSLHEGSPHDTELM